MQRLAAVYTGQTSRALKTSTKEHSKAAACFDKTYQLAQHSQKTGHSFDFENVSILHICPQWNQRLFLEPWYSNKEENQRARWVSTCLPQSQEFLEKFLAHALCIFVTDLPILPSLVIFAYVTDEGHRSDRNVLLFKNFLISVNAAISFYIMPDYNHGIIILPVFSYKVRVRVMFCLGKMQLCISNWGSEFREHFVTFIASIPRRELCWSWGKEIRGHFEMLISNNNNNNNSKNNNIVLHLHDFNNTALQKRRKHDNYSNLVIRVQHMIRQD